MTFSALDWLEWENPVAIWWVYLSAVGGLNVALWLWTRYVRVAGTPRGDAALLLTRRLVALSGVYVFVCAFRLVMPRADVQKICMFDTWLSNVLVGRSVATLGELAFMTQWALLLAYAARETGSLWAGRIAKVIVPAIVFAECCSWYAVISTSYIGNAMEESTWALTWVLVAVALALMLSRFSGALRVATVASLFGIGVYVLFMVQHDVPMYVTRWQADVASGKAVLGLFDGFNQLAHRWVVTHDIAEWKTEIPWMTLYFSFAVWASIGLCHLPLRSDQLAKYLKNPPLGPGDRPVELAVGVGQLGPQ